MKHVHRHAFGELSSWRIRHLRKAATRRRLRRWAKRVAKVSATKDQKQG